MDERSKSSFRFRLSLPFFFDRKKFFSSFGERKNFQLRRGTGLFRRAGRAFPAADGKHMAAVHLRAVEKGGMGGRPGAMRASMFFGQPCRCAALPPPPPRRRGRAPF